MSINCVGPKPFLSPVGASDLGGVGGGGRRSFSFKDIPSFKALSPVQKQTLVAGREVFLRVDLNLKPKKGALDPKRLEAALPIIKELSELGAIVYIASHRSDPKDPKGKVAMETSMGPVAKMLGERLPGKKVVFAGDHIQFNEGEELTALNFQAHIESLRQKAELKAGDVVVLENLRFYPDSTKKLSEDFAKTIAQCFGIYIDDAFGTAHRAHASMIVARYMPEGKSFVGPLMEKEMEMLRPILVNPRRPFVGSMSGSKVTTEEGKEGKIDILKGVLPLVDKMILAGGLGNAVLCAARGIDHLGAYKPTAQDLQAAKELLAEYQSKLVLPADLVFVKGIASFDQLLKAEQLAPADLVTVNLDTLQPGETIPENWFPADIGPATLDRFGGVIKNAQTIFANGPAGVYENELTAVGTKGLVTSIDQAAAQGAYALGGGGDFLAAAKSIKTQALRLSTGGGALLSVVAKNGEVPAFTAFF